MGLYKRPDSPYYHMCYVDPSGKLRRKSTKQTKLANAEKVYASVIGAMEAGTYRTPPPRAAKKIPPPTIGIAIDDYIRDRTETHKKKLDSYRYLDSLWKVKLPNKQGVDTITTEQIEGILSEWIEGRSGSTYCRVLDQLSGFLTWCRRKRWIDDHPIRGLFERPPQGKTRRGFVKRHWRKPLFDECVAVATEKDHDDPQWLASIVRFAISTGLRKTKLLGRTTDHVEIDGDRVLLRVGQDKNGDPIWIELFEECRTLALSKVRGARLAKEPLLLLPGPDGGRADSSVRRYLKIAVDRLAEKRPDLGMRWGTDADAITFHALRRTFATEARRQGADLDEIMKLGNWRNRTMPMSYIQLEDERAAELLGKMARSLRTDTGAYSEVSGDAAETA